MILCMVWNGRSAGERQDMESHALQQNNTIVWLRLTQGEGEGNVILDVVNRNGRTKTSEQGLLRLGVALSLELCELSSYSFQRIGARGVGSYVSAPSEELDNIERTGTPHGVSRYHLKPRLRDGEVAIAGRVEQAQEMMLREDFKKLLAIDLAMLQPAAEATQRDDIAF